MLKVFWINGKCIHLIVLNKFDSIIQFFFCLFERVMQCKIVSYTHVLRLIMALIEAISSCQLDFKAPLKVSYLPLFTLNFQIRPTKDVSCPAYGQCTSKEGGIQAKDGTRGWVKQLTMKWKKHSILCWILIIYLYPILNSAINTMKVRIFDKGFEHNFSSWRIPGPNLEN